MTSFDASPIQIFMAIVGVGAGIFAIYIFVLGIRAISQGKLPCRSVLSFCVGLSLGVGAGDLAILSGYFHYPIRVEWITTLLTTGMFFSTYGHATISGNFLLTKKIIWSIILDVFLLFVTISFWLDGY